MPTSKFSLRALELFEITARTGSVQETAEEAGLSVSSVSHHLSRLEDQVGIALIDHSRRPMILTAAGRSFLARVEEGLNQIRLAESEAAIGDLTDTRDLKLAMIEDLESTVAPELAVTLAANMPRVTLRLESLVSHAAVDRLLRREIDIAIAAEPPDRPEGVKATPLMRDPFVLAVPRDCPIAPDTLLQGSSDLPFLRFNATHLIGRRIDAQLRRARLVLDHRFELDSTASMMGLIAAQKGWAITTPVNYLRAHRFLDAVQLHPLPIPAFHRQISVFSRRDTADPVAGAIASLMRQLLRSHCVEPATTRYPWLASVMALSKSDT